MQPLISKESEFAYIRDISTDMALAQCYLICLRDTEYPVQRLGTNETVLIKIPAASEEYDELRTLSRNGN